MRAIALIAAAILASSLLAGSASAQMMPRPMPGFGGPNPMVFMPHRIPPSDATRRAIIANPGARPLGVVTNGAGYNVRLKQGNRVFLFPVPGN